MDAITLVKGHGWAFNGKSVWKSVSERWKKRHPNGLVATTFAIPVKSSF